MRTSHYTRIGYLMALFTERYTRIGKIWSTLAPMNLVRGLIVYPLVFGACVALLVGIKSRIRGGS